MKLMLDKNTCIGCGACAAICPRFFEMGEDTKSHIKGSKDTNGKEELSISDKDKAKAKEGADACPVSAILLK